MWIWLFATSGSPDPTKVRPSSQRNPANAEEGAEEEEEEEEEERSEIAAVFRQMGPWVTSFLFHLGLVILALFLVWMVYEPEEDEDFEIVPAAKMSNNPGGLVKSEDMELQASQQVREVKATETATEESLEQLTSNTQSQLQTIGVAGGGGGGALAPFGTTTGTGTGIAAGFFGNGGNARKVIYVIDASGSLVDTMPFVLAELARSVGQLNSQQQFNVIFFQNGAVVEVPDQNGNKGWKTADGPTKQYVTQWISLETGNVQPRGRTDPRKAIQVAMRYRPELVFLLSDNITGSGRYEINRDELLKFFQGIEWKVAINTIQFLTPDPFDTLKEIATKNGGAFKFIEEKDLGRQR